MRVKRQGELRVSFEDLTPDDLRFLADAITEVNRADNLCRPFSYEFQRLVDSWRLALSQGAKLFAVHGATPPAVAPVLRLVPPSDNGTPL